MWSLGVVNERSGGEGRRTDSKLRLRPALNKIDGGGREERKAEGLDLTQSSWSGLLCEP